MGQRSNTSERGLTVLGLGVVVGGVLAIVALATVVMGTRGAVADEDAKRDAKAASAASGMRAAETGKVPTAEELAEYAPSLEFEKLEVGDEVAVQGKVYVRTQGDVSELAARSGDACFWVQRTAATTRYAKGACDGDPSALVFRDRW